jgi:hypothetical protein
MWMNVKIFYFIIIFYVAKLSFTANVKKRTLIYIKILKKMHPFLICKSPYSLGLWNFYLMDDRRYGQFNQTF